MTNYDLPAALKNYRLERKLSLSQMGRKLNMSKSAYNRLEKGLRKPYHDELVTIIQKLALDFDPKEVPSIPKPDPKWYESRQLRWVIPVVIACVVESVLVESRGFRETFGEEGIAAGKHVRVMFILGLVFCGIYWYFLPPEWPKRKPTRMEVMYGSAAAAVFLFFFFFEGINRFILKLAGPYLPDISAGLWIALSVFAAMLCLFLWSFRKTIFLSIRNLLVKQ